MRSDVGLVPARGECVLIGSEVSLCIHVMGPVVGYFSGRGGGVTLSEPLPNSRCAEFNGVESLSDLIDGDPPESMRLGKQGSPSLLESQEAISGGGRMRAVCDVHA